MFFIIFFSYFFSIKTGKKTFELYENLHKEEQEKKQQYCRECYKNLPENDKQKLVEYRKEYYRMRKKRFIIIVRKYFNLGNFSSL